LDAPNAVYRESEPTDMFYRRPMVSTDDGRKCTLLTNPLYMLLNQKRIEELADIGIDNARKWFQTMVENKSVSSELSEAVQNLSNAEIMTMIRSRHIQTPSEINSWCRYMHDNMDEFHSTLKAAHDEILKQQESEKESQTTESAAT
jgi:hypothetical protein